MIGARHDWNEAFWLLSTFVSEVWFHCLGHDCEPYQTDEQYLITLKACFYLMMTVFKLLYLTALKAI